MASDDAESWSSSDQEFDQVSDLDSAEGEESEIEREGSSEEFEADSGFTEDDVGVIEDESEEGQAGKILLDYLLLLLFSGKMSAKVMCTICYWVWKAGCPSPPYSQVCAAPTRPDREISTTCGPLPRRRYALGVLPHRAADVQERLPHARDGPDRG